MTVRLDFKIFEKYVGKFIARRNSEVIDYADEFEELIEKLRRRGIDPRKVIIDYVPEEPLYYLI